MKILSRVVLGIFILTLSPVGLPAETPTLPYNVLWLTGESLQAKHLGCYGYDKPTSPNIDAFSKTGTLFLNCISPSGWTSESMVSQFTGVYSPVHGVITRDRHIPPEWYVPLERLRDAGYTIPRMQAYHTNKNQQYMGYTEDEANNLEPWDWLEQHRDQRFFMWYHLWESHLPYDPPEPHRSLFWKDEYIRSRDNEWRINLVRTMNIIPRSSVRFYPEEDAEGVRALYDGSIHRVDEKFGKIIDAVNRLGLRKNTLILYTADHGEGMLEHGLVGHASTLRGGTLYDEVIKVPLILSLPGIFPEGKRIESQVGGVDLMPTLFELLGLSPEVYFQGESLIPLMKEQAKNPDPVCFAASSYKGYQEDDPEKVENLLRAVRTPEWKLIYQILNSRKSYELYHLESDPGEQRNVKNEYPLEFQRMKRKLDHWLKECRKVQIRLESES